MDYDGKDGCAGLTLLYYGQLVKHNFDIVTWLYYWCVLYETKLIPAF